MTNKVPPSAIPVPGRESTHGGSKKTMGTLPDSVAPGTPKGFKIPHGTAGMAGKGSPSKPLPKGKAR